MSRLAPLPLKELSSEGQQLQGKLDEVFDKAFGSSGHIFEYKDKNGAYIGPVPFYLAVPKSGNALMDYVTTLGPQNLPPAVRETAILAVGGHFQAGYELYAHSKIAIQEGLLTEDQCEAMKQDKRPSDLDEDCSLAYDIAKYLSGKKGPLPQSMWDESIKRLGQDGTVALMHYVAWYAYTCVVLNFADVPVPNPVHGE